jgi:hypothetical protein
VRLLLSLKGIPPTKKYAEAATAFTWLITGPGSTLYSLMPNYRDNFLITSENIGNLCLKYSTQEKMMRMVTMILTPAIRMNTGASIAKFYAPSGPGFQDGAARRWVVNEFHQERTVNNRESPRLAATFLYDSTDVGGPTVTNVYGRTWASRYPASDPNANNVYYRKLLNDHWRDNEIFNSQITIALFVMQMYCQCMLKP